MNIRGGANGRWCLRCPFRTSHVSDLVSMGTIAMDQLDKNEGLFIFAVGKLEDMLNEFKARYYVEEFPI
ncbi:hypothetical protein SAMN05444169_1398 [Bradyrhizobium erythrophlei]|uniref:Uncharacterized protein n=1 Tax=Bradyrhizobium erythrophlei TaxID=1437360 RepID=A0A1M5I954_9BRAD|nr:hypothetical protein SAMN05444169_1398 [Bradyrhizobium erythrophlei]